MRTLLGALALFAACASAAAPPADITREQQVKAAYLYNFARFTTWPASRLSGADPILFCVLNGDPVAAAMQEALAGKDVNGHPAAVLKTRSVEEMRACHVAFLGTAAPAQLAAALQALGGAGVLTVHEGGSVQHAGMVRLFIDEHRLRFEINVAAAERDHLLLSSRLLGVARVVRD